MGVGAIGCKTCGNNSPLKQVANTLTSIPNKVGTVFQTVIEHTLTMAGELTRSIQKSIYTLHDQALATFGNFIKNFEIPTPNISLLKGATT